MGKQSKDITFHYIKNSGYRLFPSDGAFGGITSRGKICVNFFAERAPIPKSTKYKIDKNGSLDLNSAVHSSDSKEGIIREIESGILMDIDTAIQLRDWLTDKINIYLKQAENAGNVEKK